MEKVDFKKPIRFRSSKLQARVIGKCLNGNVIIERGSEGFSGRRMYIVDKYGMSPEGRHMIENTPGTHVRWMFISPDFGFSTKEEALKMAAESGHPLDNYALVKVEFEVGQTLAGSPEGAPEATISA